jgi:hypothetical protein
MDSVKLTSFDNKKTITITKENIEYLFKLVLEDDSIGNLTINQCVSKVWIYFRSWLKVQFDFDIYKGYNPSSDKFPGWLEGITVELYKKELDNYLQNYQNVV